jgi:hypothetical protein
VPDDVDGFEPARPRGIRSLEKIERAEVALLIALCLVGLGLRLYRIGDGLWFDEMKTDLGYARAPFSSIVRTFDSQNQHPLYSLLAHASLLVFGPGAGPLRVPAAVFGTASLWALWWFARRVAPRIETFAAVILLTFSYHHVWFSQNARGYTGLLFWTLVASRLFIDLLAGSQEARGAARARCAVLYALAMAAGVYTHATAAIVAIAHGAIWLVWRVAARGPNAPSASPFLAVLLAGVLALLFYAPMLGQLFGTLSAPTMPGVDIEWKRPAWLVEETLKGLARGLPGGLLGVAAGAAVFGLGVLSYARQGPCILALLLLAPFLTGALLLTLGHNLWPRFFFFAAGFLVLITLRGLLVPLGAGVLARWRDPLQLAALGLLVLAGAWTLPRAYGPKQDFAGALAMLAASRSAQDAVVTIDMTTLPLRDYLGADCLAVESVEQLEEIERAHVGVWLAYTFPTRLWAEYPGLRDKLERDYEVVEAFGGTLGGGDVYVARRR